MDSKRCCKRWIKHLKRSLFVPEYGKDGRYIVVGSGSTIIVSDQVFNRATGETSQTNGIVTSITVTNGGFGYSQDNPPSVLIESPLIKKEKLILLKQWVILVQLLELIHSAQEPLDLEPRRLRLNLFSSLKLMIIPLLELVILH